VCFLFIHILAESYIARRSMPSLSFFSSNVNHTHAGHVDRHKTVRGNRFCGNCKSYTAAIRRISFLSVACSSASCPSICVCMKFTDKGWSDVICKRIGVIDTVVIGGVALAMLE